ncbi:MAG: hypothetical protein V4813_05920 [Gemmatimonadota bacterium]
MPRSTSRRNATLAGRSSNERVTVTHASRAYRDLVHALADSVVEYHALRHGVEVVSRVNYSLQKRVQRERDRG